MIFLKEFFQTDNFEKKISRQQKSMKNYPVCNELNSHKIPPVSGLLVKACVVSGGGGVRVLRLTNS